ncbi:MAG: sigma-70 family RNA polymerase sigma factor [Candidatus Eisenbacteria bacterium]|uniref:Sigma-70 family RNA polymerase sigma factor n=1 Tax=Eiseniibacteriota bacterium TaxID=2212470 RepID=A0A948RTI1_UNCEI|nr:sigma-70 family RNA polymerase sigma factor [Candidatus Eisenbacteria bacterium]MBU1948914.1 sigma-70 family RNA polymerase sigma factor [Candidatus Eisenbacteria bacterium]MBU2690600.1 sigma-70 family RNA polymerase sigma factor [Candidatus Eisenbacteria bacterium]
MRPSESKPIRSKVDPPDLTSGEPEAADKVTSEGPDKRPMEPGNAADDILQLNAIADEDLMGVIVQGREDAFEELVRRYRGKIINLVHRFINDRERAQELSQEVFLRVFVHRKRYRRSGKFSTWIYTIAVNLAKNEIRRKVRLRGQMSLDALLEMTGDSAPFFADDRPKPDRRTHQREVERIVTTAISTLPPKYREVLILRDIQQLSYEEIEQVVGIPGGTVRSRINRARQALKERLEPILGGDKDAV